MGWTSFRLQKLEHERCETYSLRIIENTEFLLDDFGADDEFMSIARIGVFEKTSVDKIRKEKMVTKRYIATDLCDIEPENFLGIKLSHWNIEAQHWILDMQLDEDRQRQRLGNSKTNSTAFRRFLMALAKDPKHTKLMVSKFMICCQNRFDEKVNTLLKMESTEK
jgi:predicted transposase YbfD/YdcC